MGPDHGAAAGRSYTKPVSLLKDSNPIRTWAQWDHAVFEFVEIDLVGHEGGNAIEITVWTRLARRWRTSAQARSSNARPGTSTMSGSGTREG